MLSPVLVLQLQISKHVLVEFSPSFICAKQAWVYLSSAKSWATLSVLSVDLLYREALDLLEQMHRALLTAYV